MLHTPILFIIFNRIDTAQQVFNSIRNAQPLKLYIACDGARTHIEGETEKCERTRALIKQIDWPCKVQTNFLNINEGPSKAPYHFIKWFFEHEEQGIILEHDCLPHPDFFNYCEILLEKYKFNNKIGAISGSNFVPHTDINSYTFTIYNHIWGWATWRRVINHYTLDFSNYPYSEFKKLLNNYFNTQIEKIYWSSIFKQIKKGEIPTWDYYLTFCLWRHNFYSISPNKNLISNIGFGKEAINTINPNSPSANMPTSSILPLLFNKLIIENHEEEQKYFKKYILENKPIIYLYLKIFLKKIGVFKYIINIKNKIISISL